MCFGYEETLARCNATGTKTFTVNILEVEFYVNFYRFGFPYKPCTQYSLQSFQHSDKARFLCSQSFIKKISYQNDLVSAKFCSEIFFTRKFQGFHTALLLRCSVLKKIVQFYLQKQCLEAVIVEFCTQFIMHALIFVLS